MRACRRDFQRPFDILLPLDICKVGQVNHILLRLPCRLRRDLDLAAQVGDKLPHLNHRDDLDLSRKRSLLRVRRRDIERLKARLLRRDCHRQHAAHRAQLSFQAQLT